MTATRLLHLHTSTALFLESLSANCCFLVKWLRRVCRYQRGNQNLSIEEEQTTQWPKEKVQKDDQRSTKHTYKTKDRVTRAPLTILL
jgi:hypothetical protein